MELERNAFVTRVEEFIKDSLSTSDQIIVTIKTPVCTNTISSSEIVCWNGVNGDFNIEYECGVLSLAPNTNATYSYFLDEFNVDVYEVSVGDITITIS